MKNVKITVFDIIAYIIPGIVVIAAFVIAFNHAIKDVEDVLVIIDHLGLAASFIILGLAYVIGFSIFGIGRSFYRMVNSLLWKDFYPINYEIKTACKWARIREFSPANFTIINKWAALKGMAQNLTVGLILLTISCITKIRGDEHSFEWILMILVSLTLSIMLLGRARAYKHYRDQDIEATLKIIEISLTTKDIHSETTN